MRQINEAGIHLIMQFEGFRPRVYLCSANYWTIGYGHMIRGFDKSRDTRAVMAGNPYPNGVTQDEATQLLTQDLQKASMAVERLIPVSLTDNQFAALVSFTFNLGSGNLRASALRRKLLRREYNAASEEFKRWIFSAGRQERGLIRRRRAERLLFLAQTSAPSISG